MRREVLIGLMCGGLAACVAPIAHPPPAANAPVLGSDLASARLACNKAYPAGIGDYTPHAECVNAAVERFAVPGARYPDLVRLQEEARVKISRRIDSGAISPQGGETQMTRVDDAIDAAERERNLSHPTEADEQIARIAAILGN
jgi:hypothetical protein